MNTAPKIPGMSAFPELEKKYEASYRAAVRKGCSASCDKAKVIAAFRYKLEQRRERDKWS
jgi:hypothetical protein